jgi:hypothetical protein
MASQSLLTLVFPLEGKWDPKPGEKKGQLMPFEGVCVNPPQLSSSIRSYRYFH